MLISALIMNDDSEVRILLINVCKPFSYLSDVEQRDVCMYLESVALEGCLTVSQCMLQSCKAAF